MELSQVQDAIKNMKARSNRLHAAYGEPVKFLTDSEKRVTGCVFEDEDGKKHELYFFPNVLGKQKQTRKARLL